MKAGQVKEEVGGDGYRPMGISIAPDAEIEDAVELMAHHKVHHLLVKEGDDFKGILEARHIPFAQHRKTHSHLKVADVMRTRLPMIYKDTDLGTALTALLENRLTALPIVHAGRIDGILTETDLLRLLNKKAGSGLPFIVKEGEAVLANPFVQNIFKMLGLAGI